MMGSDPRRLRLVLPSALLATLVVSIAPNAQAGDLLQRTIPRFVVENVDIPSALIKLGRDSGIPLGVNASDPDLWERRVSLSLQGETVDSILRAILSKADRYQYRETDGVLVVDNRAGTDIGSQFLSVRVSSFQSRNPDTAEHLSSGLWMALLLTLDPDRQMGFMGTLHPSELDKKLPPVDLSGSSVERILNWIVSSHGSAAWIAVPFRGKIQDSSVDALWRLVFYPRSPDD